MGMLVYKALRELKNLLHTSRQAMRSCLDDVNRQGLKSGEGGENRNPSGKAQAVLSDAES